MRKIKRGVGKKITQNQMERRHKLFQKHDYYTLINVHYATTVPILGALNHIIEKVIDESVYY